MLIAKHRQLGGTALVAALALSAPGRAFGQAAYFSFQGNLSTLGAKEDFGINLARSVTNAETLKFQTYSRNGGTNAAGEVIAANASGIDSVLELFDGANASRGNNDDQSASPVIRDSLLSWAALQSLGTPLNPSPLPSGAYRLNLSASNNNATGPWTTDLVGPADALSLSSATASGSSSISSLKFGTTGAGANVATLNTAGALNIGGTLTIGNTGNGTMNVTGGATIVSGATNVNAGGFLTISGGTFVAQSDVVLNGGKLTAIGNSTFSLAAGKTVTAYNSAQVNFGASYDINNGCQYSLQSGASLATVAILSIGTLGNGLLTVDGVGTTLTVGTGSTSANCDIGANTGGGSLFVTNHGAAMINTPGVAIGASLGAAQGTVTVNSSGTVNLNNLLIGSQSAGTGTLTIIGAGSAVTQSGASTVTVGAPPGATGTGTINVQTSGVFSSGTGAIAVQKTGAIVIGGGTFNANGEINLDGGKLTFFETVDEMIEAYYAL